MFELSARSGTQRIGFVACGGVLEHNKSGRVAARRGLDDDIERLTIRGDSLQVTGGRREWPRRWARHGSRVEFFSEAKNGEVKTDVRA